MTASERIREARSKSRRLEVHAPKVIIGGGFTPWSVTRGGQVVSEHLTYREAAQALKEERDRR